MDHLTLNSIDFDNDCQFMGYATPMTYQPIMRLQFNWSKRHAVISYFEKNGFIKEKAITKTLISLRYQIQKWPEEQRSWMDVHGQTRHDIGTHHIQWKCKEPVMWWKTSLRKYIRGHFAALKFRDYCAIKVMREINDLQLLKNKKQE